MTDCTVAQEVRGGLRLGDLVRFNERAPYYGDWIGVDLKVVSLRLDPSGKQWVSGIEGDQKHRGNGVYDAETTDIDAEYLDLVHRAHPQPAAGAERPFACKECGALYSHEPTCRSPVRSGLEEALQQAEASFENIRTILINNINEPERRAFWQAVKGRDAIRAALKGGNHE